MDIKYDVEISINAFKKDEINLKKKKYNWSYDKDEVLRDIVPIGYTTPFQRCDTRFIRSMDLI